MNKHFTGFQLSNIFDDVLQTHGLQITEVTVSREHYDQLIAEHETALSYSRAPRRDQNGAPITVQIELSGVRIVPREIHVSLEAIMAGERVLLSHQGMTYASLASLVYRAMREVDERPKSNGAPA